MTILSIVLGILIFSGYIFILKKSQLDRCNLFAFLASVYFTGFISSTVPELVNKGIYSVPATVVILAAAAGIASIGSSLLQLVSINMGGKLSVINVISNLYILIPIVYSFVFFHEIVSLTKCTGILLFVAFVFLLNYSGQKETSMKKWPVFALFSMVLGGIVVILQKYVTVLNMESYISIFLGIAYFIGFSLCLAIVVIKKYPVRVRTLLYGLEGGLLSYLGSYMYVVLIGIFPSSLIVPLYSLGSIITVTIGSSLIFGEKIKSRQRAVLAVGFLAVAALCI